MRGLWFRVYHLNVSFSPVSKGVGLSFRTRATFPMFSGDRRNVEVFAEVERLFHHVAAGLSDQVAGNPRQRRLEIRRPGQLLHQFRLRDRLGIADIECFSDCSRLVHGADHGGHQIVDIDELHQTVAVARNDDGTSGAQAVPEELLRGRNGCAGRKRMGGRKVTTGKPFCACSRKSSRSVVAL